MNSPIILFFSDIDGCLLQTKRHVPDVDTVLCYTSGSDKDLVATNPQLSLFELFKHNSIVIPVTARPLERVLMLNRLYTFDSYKICDSGITIYDKDNNLIEDYSNSLIGLVSTYQSSLKDIIQLLSVSKLISSFKQIVYKQYIVGIEGTGDDEASTKYALAYLSSKFSWISFNVNGSSFFISVVPSFKDLACKYVLQNIDHYDLSIGFGDSSSDLPFMNLMDYSLVPNSNITQINMV